MAVDWLGRARGKALSEALKQHDQGGSAASVVLVLPDGRPIAQGATGPVTSLDYVERLRAEARAVCAVAGVAVIPTYLNVQPSALGHGSNGVLVVVSGPEGSRASLEMVEVHQGQSCCFPYGVSFPCDDVVFGGMFQRQKPVKPTLSLLKGKVQASGS